MRPNVGSARAFFIYVLLFALHVRAVAGTPDLPAISVVDPITCLGEWKEHVWIGTEKGLYRCNLDLGYQTKIALPGESATRINCLYVADDKLYVGTDKGLYFLDSAESTSKSTVIKANVFRLIQLSGKLLVCERKQVTVLDGDRIDSRLKDYSVTDIGSASDGNSCFAAVDKYGCYQFYFENNELKVKETCQAPGCYAIGIHDVHLFCTIQLGASDDYHAVRFDLSVENTPRLTSLTKSRPSGKARQFAVHKNKSIWMAASDGLFKLNPRDEDLPLARIPGIDAVAIVVHGDQMFFATAHEVRFFRGMNGTAWYPFRRFHPFYFRFSGNTVEIPVTQIDYDERTTHKYLAVSDLPSIRQNRDGSFTILELPTLFKAASIEIEDLNGTKARREFSFFSVPLTWFIGVCVGLAVIIALFHVPILYHCRVADWEVWQMGDAPWVKAIPTTRHKKDTKYKKKNNKKKIRKADGSEGMTELGWLYTRSDPNGVSVAEMKAILFASKERAYRLVTETDPGEHSREATSALVSDYVLMRGDQARSYAIVDFDPMIMAISIGSSASKKTRLSNKSKGKLRFATIGNFDEDKRPEQTRRLGLKWQRWWSSVVNGFQPPRRIIDAIHDCFSGWGGAECLPTRGDVEGFKIALQTADVVHVLAHGEKDRLDLNEPLSTSNLVQFLDDPSIELRSKLVVFSACDVGLSFVQPLVKKGVTVLAARTPLHVQDTLVPFFCSFYQHLFPRRLAQEVTLAEAYRGALKAIPVPPFLTRGRKHKSALNGLILYGDPSLCFRFSLRWPFSKGI